MKFTLTASILAFATLTLAQIQATPIILAIAPGSKSCAADNKECRTAEQASPFLASAMSRYKLYNVNEMAAVISLMAFESVDFAYKTNQFPGRPGQGTANMQMAEFNLKYAKSIDKVKDKVADISSVDGLSDDKLNEIRALVIDDEYNFASGPWFLTTQCEPSVREQLRNDIDKGFAAYMSCVGVTVDEDRTAYLERAKKAFNIKA